MRFEIACFRCPWGYDGATYHYIGLMGRFAMGFAERLQPRRIYVMPSSLLMRSTPQSFSGPVVIDEIHHYRNPETRLWSSAMRLLESAPYRIGLSATPINNDLADLAAELSLLLRLNRYV